MNLIAMVAAFVASGLVLAVMVVHERRPYRPGKLSYISLMIICLAACLVLGRHLLSLVVSGN